MNTTRAFLKGFLKRAEELPLNLRNNAVASGTPVVGAPRLPDKPLNSSAANAHFGMGSPQFKTTFTPRDLADNIYGKHSSNVISRAQNYVKNNPGYPGVTNPNLIDKPVSMYATLAAPDLNNIPNFKNMSALVAAGRGAVGVAGMFDPATRKGYVDVNIAKKMNFGVPETLNHEFLSHGLQDPAKLAPWQAVGDRLTKSIQSNPTEENVVNTHNNMAQGDIDTFYPPGAHSGVTNTLQKLQYPTGEFSMEDVRSNVNAMAASNKMELEPRLANYKRQVFKYTLEKHPNAPFIIDSPNKAQAAITELLELPGVSSDNPEINGIRTLIDNTVDPEQKKKLLDTIYKILPGLVQNRANAQGAV